MASLSFSAIRTYIVWQTVLYMAIVSFFQTAAVSVDRSNGVPQQRIKRDPTTRRMYYASVCDGRTMDLRCPENLVLKIERANYGRTDLKTCIVLGTPETDNQCFWAPYSYNVVSQRCDGRRSCRIDVSIYQFLGDPCNGVAKYLEVQFECIPSEPVKITSIPEFSTTAEPTPVAGQSLVQSNTTLDPVEQTTRMIENDLSTFHPDTSIEGKTTTKSPQTVAKVVHYATNPTGPIMLNICQMTVQRSVIWEETVAGTTVRAPCPEGTTGAAVWACVGSPARWFPQTGPDLSNCISPWVNNISKMVEMGQSSNIITAALAEATDQEQDLYGGDVLEVVNILSYSLEKTRIEIEHVTVEEKEAYTTEVTENVIATGSNILADRRKASWDDLPKKDKSDTATSLLSALEQSAFLMADSFMNEKIFVGEAENVLMEVLVHEMTKATFDLQFPNTPNVMNNWIDMKDTITISSASIKDKQQDGKVKLVFFAYNNMEELLGVPHTSKDAHVSKTFVNSRIMSLSINTPLKSVPLKEPVNMLFNHLKSNGSANPSCSFWKFHDRTRGEWSNEGCRVVSSNQTHTECSCDHLTNFAIIMDIRGVEISELHTFALSTITYAGFTISIACLLMSFITFTAFKNLQNDRNTIHKNLCLCLLTAELVFLIGIDRGDSPNLCTVVAVLLHYFFLASFAWMCLEGIQLYVMLVEVFEAESSRRKYYYPFGYGVPLVTVAIAALANYNGYGTKNHCWLEVENNFIWSFIGPVCIVIMVNTVFLTMAFVIMCRHSTIATNRRQKTTKKKKVPTATLR